MGVLFGWAEKVLAMVILEILKDGWPSTQNDLNRMITENLDLPIPLPEAELSDLLARMEQDGQVKRERLPSGIEIFSHSFKI